MANNNCNLNAVKDNPDRDEYYTRWQDVFPILGAYARAGIFCNKRIYCPADNIFSAFCDFFIGHYERLKLKDFTATSYHYPISYAAGKGTITQYRKSRNKKYILKGDGDMFSKECQKIMDKSDIIVTNPPFSLKAPLIDTLLHKKTWIGFCFCRI